MIRPFHIDVPDETLDHIRARVAEYPWHEMPEDGGWDTR
jgi:microsomal epoxide hydrolase|tara:strand:- start:1082 stop:1198 length:117 start_codon:yes stop_codon:yes gene_type:complete